MLFNSSAAVVVLCGGVIMANWKWECQTCAKARSCPGSGICFPCLDDKCEYEPFQNFATTSTEYNPNNIPYYTSNSVQHKEEK